MRFERLLTTLLVLILLCLLHPHLASTTADDVQRQKKEGTPVEPASTDEHQLTNAPAMVTIKLSGEGIPGGEGGGRRGGMVGGRSGGSGGGSTWIPYNAAGGSSHLQSVNRSLKKKKHHRKHKHHNGTSKGIHDGICLSLVSSVLLVLSAFFPLL